jgi:hypothetical protein
VIIRSVLGVACLLGIISTAWSADPSACAEDVFSKKKIVEVMRSVREYQLAHPWKETDRDWIRATYYTGVMGLYRTTEDPEILAQAQRWAQKHGWTEGSERHPANKKTCGQTYLTHEYAMGLFLLAGEEMVKLLQSGVVSAEEIAEFEQECREETEHGRWSSKTAWPDSVRSVEMPLSDSFRRLQAPETGRAAIQLTAGDAFCYPLYYFIPSFTQDAKYLIHHRAEKGEVQLHRLNLRTGESAQLTHGDTPDTRWKNSCVGSGSGVLDHRSVLNVARGEVVYFTGPLGNDARLVNVTHTSAGTPRAASGSGKTQPEAIA